MKRFPTLLASLCALLPLGTPCLAQGDKQQYCEVSLGALTLPGNSDGLLHWIGSEASSQELQLSTRYFSERIKPKSAVLRLYGEATTLVEGEPIPEPLLTIKVPPGAGLLYVVLWSESDEDGQARWRFRTLNAKDWKRGTMKLVNASREPLGLMVGEKKFKMAAGQSQDFAARDWPEAFPAKVYLTEPEVKMVFSSKWRITPASRELCFLTTAKGAVALRSLIDLAEPAAP